MKARITSGLAALLAICLCAEFGPAIFNRCRNCRSNGTQASASTKTRSLKWRREQALSDFRTAASALHYLIEPEPDQPFQLTVVSNSPARNLARANTTPLTLASNAAVQTLARSNASASPWILGSNVARPRILGPLLSEPQTEPQTDPQPAATRPSCCSRTCLAG